MCGIAGYFGPHVDIDTVKQMLAAMLHRGYSHYEIKKDGSTYVSGANRLQIVDRENANQPLSSYDGRYLLTFNGEIYNFRELKCELKELGIPFGTSSDTEVLANGLAAWGIDLLLDKISGMYAFSAWDKSEQRLILARDPMGIKPLYYAAYEGKLLFSSEIKGMLRAVKGNSIKHLPPGYYLSITTETHQLKPHFSLPKKLPVQNNSTDSHPTTLRQAISSAVQQRIATDLPIAVLLSGGIDSSIILYEALQGHKDVTAFVIGCTDAPDVQSAKRFCEGLDVELVHIPFTVNDALAYIEKTIIAIETFEPNHIRAGVASYALAEHIKNRGFRVALCGEGADELLLGYPEFAAMIKCGETEDAVHGRQLKFLSDLHRTQLQRVDRTGMAHTLEIRTPFLDLNVLKVALELPFHDKLRQQNKNAWNDKWALREAYRGLLPDWVVDRDKCVLSEGAGLGANGPDGPFFEHGISQITEETIKQLQQQHPEYQLQGAEEATYFQVFWKHFPDVKTGLPRPEVTRT